MRAKMASESNLKTVPTALRPSWLHARSSHLFQVSWHLIALAASGIRQVIYEAARNV